MILIIKGHSFHYEMENLCRVFFPYEKINTLAEMPQDISGQTLCVTELIKNETDTIVSADLHYSGKHYRAERTVKNSCDDYEKTCERIMAHALYEVLTKACEYIPQWGILTGVRPIKLMRSLIESEGSVDKAKEYFRKDLLVSDEKINLAAETEKNQEKILSISKPDSFSLYISIPFCPTRCAYCSFVSQSVEKSVKLIPEYVKFLCKEIEITAKIAKDLNLRLETIYFGGGTPTAISSEQLTSIMSAIKDNFDLSFLHEYTIEAGRPDTIDMDKLYAMKQYGVTRISINPQTLSDDVLQAIGRRHTAQQAIDAFNMARQAGFDNINMDLIAGLPLDTHKKFANTLDKILLLNPENITVHTLALKRSSNLTKSGEKLEASTAGKMLDIVSDTLPKYGYIPYYLYRQSRMVGNLENTGWSKPGFECLYNVFIMDETHTILSCGAGGVTKIKQPDGPHIERIFNYKFPYEYNGRFDQLMERKGGIYSFYEKYGEASNKGN